MRTRHVLIAITAACALALAGCGSSKSTSGSSSTPTGGATSASTPATLTFDQAKTVAAAGILQATDVPSILTGTAQTEDADDQKDNAALSACTGTTPDADMLYRDLGTEFADSDDQHEIDSSVDVTKTAQAAQADLTALAAAKALNCPKQVLAADVQAAGGTLTSVEVTPVTAPAGSFAFHLVAKVSNGGQTLQDDEYDAGSVVGQVEISVTESSFSGTPYTAEDTLAHLAVVTSRVEAAIPS